MNALTLYMVNAVQHLLVAFLCSPEVGLSLTAAGLYSSLVFAASLVGKVVFGFALDRPRRRSYALCGCAMLAVGSGLTLRPSWSSAVGSGGGTGGSLAGGLRLAAAGSHLQLSLFALTFGLGYGGTFTLVLSRAAQLYGGESDFAKLQSCLAAAQCEPTHSDVPPPRSFRASFASHPRLFAPASALPSYMLGSVRVHRTSEWAVPPDVGSFLGVTLTAQLRDPETGSFVLPFALLPQVGLLNFFHCTRVFSATPAQRPRRARLSSSTVHQDST